MYSVSQQFLDTLLVSHTSIVKVEVYEEGNVIAVLNPVDGSVSVDRTASVRRRCSLTFVDTEGDLVPATGFDLLSPFSGHELKVYRGVRYQSGGVDVDEYVPLGVFDIARLDIEDQGHSFRISVDGYDRSRKISRSRFTDSYDLTAVGQIEDAVAKILRDQAPGVPYMLEKTGTALWSRRYQVMDDPWEKITQLASEVGFEAHVDQHGTVRMQPEPDPAALQPVVKYLEDGTSTLLSISKGFDNEHVYNDVIVSGESTNVIGVVRGESMDLNPQSPTYVYGPYGRVPYFFTSNFIADVPTATAAAAGLLYKVSRSAEDVSFYATPNPALDVNDAVYVTRTRMKIDATYLVERIWMPLKADGAMSISARKRVL